MEQDLVPICATEDFTRGTWSSHTIYSERS